MSPQILSPGLLKISESSDFATYGYLIKWTELEVSLPYTGALLMEISPLLQAKVYKSINHKTQKWNDNFNGVNILS